MRDSQKGRVYAAESVLHKKEFGGGERIESIEEIAMWIAKLQRYAWFKRRWPLYVGRKFRLADGRGTRIARGGGGWMNLPRWSRTKATIIHELAHNLSYHRPAHGWQFAKTLRELVRFVFGKDAERALVASYKAERVRYKRPRKARPGATRALPRGNPEALRRWREGQMAAKAGNLPLTNGVH